MEIEELITEYLFEYGNTKQSDLIAYVKNQTGISERRIKTIIGKLEKKGKIFRVIHIKLKPVSVYYSLKEHLPLEILKELIRAGVELKKAEFDYYARIDQ